jgi:hypothetical protein
MEWYFRLVGFLEDGDRLSRQDETDGMPIPDQVRRDALRVGKSGRKVPWDWER